jgi:hypothetical protein
MTPAADSPEQAELDANSTQKIIANLAAWTFSLRDLPIEGYGGAAELLESCLIQIIKTILSYARTQPENQRKEDNRFGYPKHTYINADFGLPSKTSSQTPATEERSQALSLVEGFVVKLD